MIIGITGRKQAGKDTVGLHLVKCYGYTKYSFAMPIKEMCKSVFGWTEDHVNGHLKEDIDPFWGVSPREVMQIMGTEIFQYEVPKHLIALKQWGRSFWVKRFERWIECNKNITNIVITDVRYPHEVDFIESLGGFIWRIIRPGTDVGDKHASEVEMDSIVPNLVVHNDKSIAELYKYIDGMMNKLNRSNHG